MHWRGDGGKGYLSFTLFLLVCVIDGSDSWSNVFLHDGGGELWCVQGEAEVHEWSTASCTQVRKYERMVVSHMTLTEPRITTC